MRVYLFSDYLKAINGEPLQESQAICEIEGIQSMPDSLVQIQGKLAHVCMMAESDLYIEYVGDIPKLDEVDFSDEITCPHCGNEDRDSWEAGDSDDAHGCDTCGSIFSYERDVSVSYSSKIVERNDKVLLLR